MFEVRDELLDGFYYFRFGEVFLLEDAFELKEEVSHFVHWTTSAFANHPEAYETFHINLFSRDIELLLCFFAGGVRLEVNHSISVRLIGHLSSIPLCLWIILALYFGETLRLYEIVTDG